MGQRLEDEPQGKETAGPSSTGSEGADDRLCRIGNAEQSGEDVNPGSEGRPGFKRPWQGIDKQGD